MSKSGKHYNPHCRKSHEKKNAMFVSYKIRYDNLYLLTTFVARVRSTYACSTAMETYRVVDLREGQGSNDHLGM